MWTHIDSLCSYDHGALVEELYALKSCLYESIYTVNNMYSDFIILQDDFITWNVGLFWHFDVEFDTIYKLS